MKRNPLDPVGRPNSGGLSEKSRPDVLGRPRVVPIQDVASYLDAKLGAGESDASMVREFAEFLSGASYPESPLFPMHGTQTRPDPLFEQRLRRRLWRMHLLAQPAPSSEPH